MESTTTPVSTSSVGIRYGLAVGLVGVILDLVLKSTGLGFKSPLVAFILAAAVWVVGITLAHKFYKRLNGGFMTYGQGVVIGLIIGLIYGLLSGIFTYIYVNFLDANYVTSVRDYTEQTLAKFNLPEEAVEKGLADITQEKLGSPLAIGKAIFGGGLGGLVLSLIISAITKHTRPEFE
jgi:tetrahydromethanopterin S-methyltransferase subunit G